MKRIVIDMDDVICDGGFLKLVNRFLNTKYILEDITNYYIQDLIPKERTKEWNIYFMKQNMYDYVDFLPNAYQVIEKLNKQYDIYILTAYVHRDLPEYSGKFLEYKYNWLYEKLPFINPNQYIFTTNKSIIQCDIRIDDKLSNLEGNAETKFLFTSYHNKNYTEEYLKQMGVIRVNDWKAVEEILL